MKILLTAEYQYTPVRAYKGKERTENNSISTGVCLLLDIIVENIGNTMKSLKKFSYTYIYTATRAGITRTAPHDLIANAFGFAFGFAFGNVIGL